MFIIIIGPNIKPHDIIDSLQILVVPELFYWIYFVTGGIATVIGVFLLIKGLVFRFMGYKDGDYI